MSTAQLENPSILVVDDDEMQLALARRILTRAGYEVRTASDGARALQSILEDAPDIVLTDWHMPVMDGLELCGNLRDNEGIPFVLVVIVTADENTTDGLVAALDAGADDYLAKPIDERALLARLRSARRTIELRRELARRSLEVHRANAEMAVMNDELARANDRLEFLATTDELTGLYNRREANRLLSQAWSASQEPRKPLSCIMVDIDHFKRFNDAHGHHTGDVILKETAEVLRCTVRRHEHVCRIGGEEFLIICPDTKEDEAAIAAERLRKLVSENTVGHDSLSLGVTISLGVAGKTPLMEAPEELRQAADESLYAAKRQGRNRVCCARVKLVHTVDEKISAQPVSVEGSSGRPLTVLLVDENPTTSAKSRRSLEHHGHKVHLLCDANSLVEYAAKHIPDVIMIDAGLEEPICVDCIRSLRNKAATQATPIILMSARRDGSDVIAGIEAGANDYLTKPLNQSELVLRVQTLVRMREELDESNSVRGEQTRALGVISELSRSLAAASGLADMLDLTLDATAELLCSDRIVALRPTHSGEALTVAGQLGLVNAPGAKSDIPIAGSAIGRVFTGEDPFLITTADDLATDFCEAEKDLLFQRPSVAVALCGPGHSVGVLVVGARGGGHTITALDLVYMNLICNMAGAAIDDALSRQATDDARDSIVIALATLAEYRDFDTGKHLLRVTQFSRLLAEQLRREGPYRDLMTATFVSDIERAVPLHDIGKVAIPDHILLKPGKLTTEEFEIMKGHTTIGARTIEHLIQKSPGVSFLVTAEKIAHSHHERVDGCGYPRGLSGEDLPLAARIATVADVYDAITTRRPYKEAMSHDQAAAIIYDSSGTQFDPHIVEAFGACEEAFRTLAGELADDVDDTTAPRPITASAPETDPL